MALATFDETDEVLSTLQDSLAFASQFGFHRDRLASVGLDPGDVDSLGAFGTIPMMGPKDIATDYETNPPFGSMIPDDQTVVRCNFTPSPHMEQEMPVPYTGEDLDLLAEGTAEVFRSAGVTSDDVVLNTGGFAPYPAGWTCAMAAERIGATHLPTGPGGTAEQVDKIDRYDVTTLFGFPSFLEQIAHEASPGDLEGVERLLAIGEPFTAIDGYREQVIDAYGGDIVATDAYGLSEFGGGLVAYESQEMDDMHVAADRVLIEVVDPETGELVERGEKGEMVLTSLCEHSHPVVRMRTGDLTVFEKRPSKYGEYVLPDGVLGRVDDMRKVKGVKVYPSEVQMYLAGVDGLDAANVQLRVSRPERKTDRLTVLVNGDPSVVDRDALASELRSVVSISIDELDVREDFELGDDPVIVDERE
jgi:phenylacetate-CoA ligase